MPKRCQLESILSYGSEGIVHSGLWCGTSAAIKVFSNNYVRRAENEIKLIENLNHINIIKYYGIEYEQKNAYLGMEYINGGNLYQFIQTKFNLSSYWTNICQILIDIARGMIYLHDHKIVQGDLKSHNILLRNPDYQAVICDFGISRSVENHIENTRRLQTAKGTIRWMAPEICTPPPEQSSFESDVWSYGCIILETTSALEPWIVQFNDDSLLFRALQKKDNAQIFSRICSNQIGPKHICQLLIQCCNWSKLNRPTFNDILNSLSNEHDENVFINNNDNSDQMSIDIPISKDRSYSDDDEDEDKLINSIKTKNIDENANKSNKHQGRLTGEVYTSKGSASGRPIYEGVRGGRYYLTENGKKVYLHK